VSLAPSTRWLVGLAIFAMAPVSALRAEEVKVTVLAILATDKNNNVDAELKDIAERVQKQEPKLTGFRQGRQTSKTVGVNDGTKETFALVEDEVVTVAVDGVMKKEKIRMTIKPPTLGQITYTTSCEKFFPIVTRYVTKDKERLIIAIMVEQCKK
jgi:hypothetical protein